MWRPFQKSILKEYNFESIMGVVLASDMTSLDEEEVVHELVELKGRRLGTVIVYSGNEAVSLLGGLAQVAALATYIH